MKGFFNILLESNYPIVAMIVLVVAILIKLILVIWRIIKENKALDISKHKNVIEMNIDKAGSVSIKKRTSLEDDSDNENR